jgi:uncharacterized protein YndB with AHSA1/START domain
MIFETAVDVDATPTAVWEVLADVEKWPEWTTTMTSLTIQGGKSLAAGSVVRVDQPKIGPNDYLVTEFVPGASFTWSATTLGMVQTAEHVVAARDGGGSTVRLTFRMSGPMSGLVGRMAGKTVREYLATEAAGLKARAEATA